MKTNLLFIVILTALSVACQNSNESKSDGLETATIENTQKVDSEAAVVLTVAGKIRSINTNELDGGIVNFDEPTVRYLFRKKTKKNENPRFDINFVFSDKESISELPKTYNLSENPDLHAIVSLSFFDYERDVEESKRKRLIFNKGIIKLHELSEDKIHFEFDGEAHELMNTDGRSSVSGWVNVSYK